MGFLDFLFSRNNEKAVEKVPYGDLNKWFEGKSSGFEEVKLKNAKPLVLRVSDEVERIECSLYALEESGVPKNIDKRLYKVVCTSQPNYISSMRKVLESLKTLPKVEDAIRLNEVLGAGLDTIGKLGFGDGRYLHSIHPEDMGIVLDASKKLLKLKEELDSTTKPDEVETMLKELHETSKKVNALEDEIKRLRGEVESYTAEIDKLKKSVNDERRMLQEAMEKKQSGDAANLLLDIERLKGKVDALESSIHSSVMRIARGLRKYSKKSFGSERLISKMLDEPVDTFLREDCRVICEILDGFGKTLEPKDYDVKEFEKMRERLGETRQLLNEKTKAELSSLKDELSGKQCSYDSLESHRLEAECRNRISEIESKVVDLSARLDKDKTTLEDASSESNKLKNELVEKLGGLGVQVIG
ncbi:MAG: hypothetical protein KKD39_04115 [Candidatus Altiarchaeota archaeon]|nr:hypothetical protein [Candidatus Altiarchaeota archaeon]